MTRRRVTVLDTSVASTNVGDQIIMEAVRHHLADLLSDAVAYTVASHEYMGAKSRGLIRRSDFTIAGGTNLLSSHAWIRSVWKLTPIDLLRCRNVILMGCGWYGTQRPPDLYSRVLFRSVLSRRHLHAVRDAQTASRLAAAGITNVVNTGCPTLWDITADRCAAIPTTKAAQVVTTLNTYMPDPVNDRRLLSLLHERYDTVFLWPQTGLDSEYARDLDPDLEHLAPSLDAYDGLLNSSLDIDYVGTRLHGGIRALQAGRRAIILEIDNRAREMGRDWSLPTVERSDIDRLRSLIDGPLEIRLTVPRDAIDRWKRQFRPSTPDGVVTPRVPGHAGGLGP